MPSSSLALSLTSRPELLSWPNKGDLLLSSKDDNTVSDFGTRFGNTELVSPRTPRGTSLFSNTFSAETRTTKVPFVDTKTVFRKVIEWFESWRLWQQRILLCGLTNRCSTSQLESLATTLEPIFHRDFVMSVKRRYPSASYKTTNTTKERKNVKNKKRTQKQQKSKPSILYPITSQNDLHNNSLLKNNDIIIKNDSKHEYGNSCDLVTEKHLQLKDPAVKNKPSFKACNTECVLEGSGVEVAPKTGTETDADASHLPTLSNNSFDLYPTKTLETESCKQPIKREKRTLNYEVNLRPLPPKQSTLRKEEYLHRSLPMGAMDLLKFGPVEWEELSTNFPTQHHNSWSRYNKMPSNPPSAMSLRTSADGHRHKSSLFRDVHKRDFFIGEYQAEMRTGNVRKPEMIEDIYLPIQNLYKNSKWFPETPREGTIYIKPNSAKLKLQFKQQIRQVWEWMSGWEDHEKLELLKELVKLSNASLINYLGQCLFQRLEDRNEINWLPDKLLLLIFSYMSPDEIDNASQVCRRWHYLTSLSELWIVKCREYGVHNGLKNVAEKMYQKSLKQGEEIDWRMAFYELDNITQTVIRDAPPPPSPQQSVATPDGLVRSTSGRLIDAHSANERQAELSSFRSMNDEVDTLLPGLATKLVCASNILKQSYRDMKRKELELKAKEREEERIKNEQELLGELQTPQPQTLMSRADKEKTQDEEPNQNSTSRLTHRYGGRNTMTNSRLSSRLSGDSCLDDEIVKAKAELEALKEETEPPKTIVEWVARKAEEENQVDYSLDVRHAFIQTQSLLPDSTSPKTLFRKCASTDLLLKKQSQKNKGEKEEFISIVKHSKRFDGHMESVVAMASDRKRLISGCSDGSIRVWDIRTGHTIHKLIGHKGSVQCFGFDNTVLYSGGWDCTVMVWDMVHFNRLKVLSGHKSTVSCIVHNTKIVISGCHDGTVRVWEKDGYECQKIIQIHKLHIMTMQLEDGRLLYTGASDGSIKITNILQAQIIHVFTGHSDPIHSFIIEGDLLISTNPAGQVWFWHKDKGTAEAAIQAHQAPVNAVKYRNGRLYTASSDRTVKEWDLKTMTCLRSFLGHKGLINDILNSKMVSCDTVGAIRTWEFSSNLVDLGKTADEGGSINHQVVDEDDILKGKLQL